ncbi:MAG: SGNH/GDSL hydrolase family protein [Saprospiraceae bacterium]|nr:SGNH/GDSL hydrolase family protein [Saprospiraceae bacterium]
MKKILFLLLLFLCSSAVIPPKTRWVAIGDSITYLNEHPDETGHRITQGYMTRVVEKMPDIEYINQGHNGWTSGGIADKIEELALVKADIYSIFLGTNDWWAGRPVGQWSDYQNNTGNATIYGSFRIIINKLRHLNPDARIILITPMPRVDFVYLNNFKNNAYGSYKQKNGQSLSQVADAIIAIGTYEHFKVLDLFHKRALRLEKLVKYKRLKDPATGIYKSFKYPSFINIPFDPTTDEYPYPIDAIDMTYDGLHPSDRGYELIAKALGKMLK